MEGGREGGGGELPVRGHPKASASNEVNINVCRALKVAVGNTGKSSLLMFQSGSLGVDASGRLGFLFLARSHRPQKGFSNFEGHRGLRGRNEVLVKRAPSF